MAISPSQLKTAFDPETGCMRKWGHEQIDGLRSGTTDAQQLGIDTHAMHERWYRTLGAVEPDLTSDAGILANASRTLLPRPRPLSPEWPGPEFAFKFSVNGVDYRGIIDLPYVEDGVAVILDHKTTSNLKYALDDAELADDYQRVIYAVAALRHFDTDASKARWIYTQTRPNRNGFPTREACFGPESAEDTLRRFDTVHVKAAELTRLRKTKARDLPQNFAACHAFYRKCDFYDRCHGIQIDAATRLAEINTGNNAMNPLLEQMRAGKTVAPPDSNPETPAPKAEAPAEKPNPFAGGAKKPGGFLGMFGVAKPAAPAEAVAEPPSMEQIETDEVIANDAEADRITAAFIANTAASAAAVEQRAGRLSPLDGMLRTRAQEILLDYMDGSEKHGGQRVDLAARILGV